MNKAQSIVRLIFGGIFLCFVHFVAAQNHILGTWPVGDPLCYVHFLDDSTYSYDTTGLWEPYRHTFTPAYIPDSLGGLLFQCNGTKVANAAGQLLDNGDSLTDNYYYNYAYIGATSHQSIVALPKKGNTYWLFYYSGSDSIFLSGQGSPDRLYYAVVDMDANGGAGRVIKKKMPLHKGVMGDCRLTAVRHGNGRDWWLVNHGYVNDVYNKYLVTPDTVLGPFEQHIGASEDEPDLVGGAQFAQDGNRYASGTIGGPLNLMDFDRCTGQFSNPVSISVYSESPLPVIDTNSIVDALCFSPSGQYLYISTLKYILQYDTWADSIANSRYLVVKRDSTYRNSDPFFSMFLTPHNKIMVSNFQGGPAYCGYHVIESPDSGGAACDFRKESIVVPGAISSYTLPNIINLKLEAFTGSVCDTLNDTLINALFAPLPEQYIRVFPNPANDKVFIETSGYGPGGELEVTNALGQRCYYYPNFDETTAIKTRDWPSGPYFWHITRKGQITGQGKLLVQH